MKLKSVVPLLIFLISLPTGFKSSSIQSDIARMWISTELVEPEYKNVLSAKGINEDTPLAEDTLYIELLSEIGNTVNEVAISGSYVYFNNGDLFTVADVSAPDQPTILGAIDISGWTESITSIAIFDDYAFVTGNGLLVIKVTDPHTPTVVGFLALSESIGDVSLTDGYAYLIGFSGLFIVDVSTPSEPHQVSYFETIGFPQELDVVGNYAYIADSIGRLRIIDVTNPYSPFEAGFLVERAHIWQIEVRLPYAYVTYAYTSMSIHIDEGLSIIDVSDPTNPYEVGYIYSAWSPMSLDVEGDYAFVLDAYNYGDNRSGLRVIDISNPNYPTEVELFELEGGYPVDVEVDGDLVYFASGYSVTGSLLILRYSETRILRGLVTDGHYHPLSDVIVYLQDSSGSTVMSTFTSRQGWYSFEDVPTGNNFRIRVTLRDGSTRKQIHWGKAGLLVSVVSQPFSISTGFNTRNINLADPSLNAAPIPNGLLDDLGSMYYHTTQVEEFAADRLGLFNFQPVNSVWGYAPVARTYYSPTLESVFIGEAGSDWSDPGRPMNREWHESFHHMMNETIGLPDIPPGDVNHGGFNNQTSADSWAEGWAEFFPCVLWDMLGFPNPELYRWRQTPDSFEYNWQVWDERGGQSFEEFAVASLLWDFYDPKEIGDNDNVDLELGALWNVIGVTTSNNDLNDMRDVYEALIQASLSNEDNTTVSQNDIDQIFISHGFYGDLNNNRQYDPGEEVGWAGVYNRRSSPEIPNAYIMIDVINENGDTVDNAQLLFNVNYEDSYYDYSYLTDLSGGSNDLVFLSLPPTRTVALGELTAIHSGGMSEKFSIDNAAYWKAVEESTDGYALEHTFVIHYKINLPFILNDTYQ